MAVRRFVAVAVVASAVAGPVAAGASAPALATTSVQVQAERSAAEARAGADAIDLQVARNGSLATTLTWSGGSAPYDVLIEPSKGEESYESGIDDTTLTVATEPDRGYCFEVFGSDGSESGNECVSNSR